MDLDDEELQFTRDLNGTSELGKLRNYLNGLDNIQIMLDGLPNLDDRSTEFYNEMYDRVDEETDRVTELLKTKEAKLLKNKR